MNILFISPKRICFDKTITYKFTYFGETFNFIQNYYDDIVFELYDCDIPGYTHRHLVEKIIYNEYKIIIIWCELVADIPQSLKILNLIRELSPSAKVFIYGDGAQYTSRLLKFYGFDGIHKGGDPEIAILNFINFYIYNLQPNSNLFLLLNNEYFETPKIEYLSPEDWSFPPLKLLPLGVYRDFLTNRYDYNKSLSRTDIVSVTVSRGCKFNCSYCPTPTREGSKDRRRPIFPLINWLRENYQQISQFHLSSPIFTCDREWVLQLCKEIVSQNIEIKWRVTARLDETDEELIFNMARAGCESIMVGVENLSCETHKGPKADLKKLENFSKILKKNNVSGKAYIMLGIPGQTKEDIYFTIRKLHELQLVIRPTGYTPFYRLINMPLNELLKEDLGRYDKKTFFSELNDLTKVEFYKFLLRDFSSVI